LLHRLYNVTYQEVKLLLIPRVKAPLLIAQLLHAKGLHQVNADLYVPTSWLTVKETLLQGSPERTEVVHNAKI